MSATTAENDEFNTTAQPQPNSQSQLPANQDQIPAVRRLQDDHESETASSRKEFSATATTASTTLKNETSHCGQKVVENVPSHKDSPVPIVNEFSDQSHKSKVKPKREKKTVGRKHLSRQCDSFMDVTGFSGSVNFDSLFSENATAFALHQSANNMHLVNVSLKNQIVSLKNQVNRLSFDNQRISRQNRMLLLENERLITTIQNSSLLMQSTVSSILPKREDHYELAPIKRKTSCGSKNESDLERSTRCTIKEFDNLLTTLQTKEDGRKFRELDLYFEDEHDSRKSRLKSVSQYDVIVKWLNNDEQSDDRNSKEGDDSDSKGNDSRDGDEEDSSHESSAKQSSCEEVTSKITDTDFIKNNIGSIKTIMSSTVTATATPIVPQTPAILTTPNPLLASIEDAVPDAKAMITPAQRVDSVASPSSSSVKPSNIPPTTLPIEAPIAKEKELDTSRSPSSKPSENSPETSNSGEADHVDDVNADQRSAAQGVTTPVPTHPQKSEKDVDGQKITFENLIFGDMATWMELDDKPLAVEGDKTEFLQSWLDDLKDKTRKFAESCKSSPLQIESDKKPIKNDDDMEHVEFITLCNEMIKRMDMLITKDSDKQSRRPSKSNLIMNFLLNENHSLNLKYSPKKDSGFNPDARSISSAAKDQPVHQLARDLMVNSPEDSVGPPMTSIADPDDEKSDGWKAFHKCLKDLEQVNVRRTNDAIRQTMVVRALRKLLAKQCVKIPGKVMSTTAHPTPGPNLQISCTKTPNEDDDAATGTTTIAAAVAPLQQKTFTKSPSEQQTVEDVSPKPTSEFSSKEQTPAKPETKFCQVFSNASKSIFLSNVNFVDETAAASVDCHSSVRDDNLSWIPVMRVNKLHRDILQRGFVVSSAAADVSNTDKKSRRQRIRRRKRSPNLSKISAALRRLQEEDKGMPITWLCVGLVLTLVHVKIWRVFSYIAPMLNIMYTSFKFSTR